MQLSWEGAPVQSTGLPSTAVQRFHKYILVRLGCTIVKEGSTRNAKQKVVPTLYYNGGGEEEC